MAGPIARFARASMSPKYIIAIVGQCRTSRFARRMPKLKINTRKCAVFSQLSDRKEAICLFRYGLDVFKDATRLLSSFEVLIDL